MPTVNQSLSATAGVAKVPGGAAGGVGTSPGVSLPTYKKWLAVLLTWLIRWRAWYFKRAWFGHSLVFLAALFFATVCSTPPGVTAKIDVDSSWAAVLDYANQHHLQFGRDIAFTYGPLGYLSTTYFLPHSALLRLYADATLYFFVALAVCLMARQMNLLWRCLLIGFFFFVATNIHSAVDVLINLGLLCWALLCREGSGPSLVLRLAVFAGLAVCALMTKATYLVMAGLTLSMVVCDLVLRGKRKTGAVLLMGFVLGFLVSWGLLGQQFRNLGRFLQNALESCRGYDAAMGWHDDQPTVFWGCLVVCVFGSASVILRALNASNGTEKFRTLRGCLLVTWLAALLFITWKHAFVRADRYHLEFYLFFVPVLVLLLEALPSRAGMTREWARATAAVCCVVGLLTLPQMFFPGYLEYCLKRPFRLGPQNVRALIQPRHYLAGMNAEFQRERRNDQLPKMRELIGESSVDIFGWSQAYALYNNLNYHPRPVFQSYAAYTPTLMRLNTSYFASPQAPEFVLFRLSSLDQRVPALDDAMLLREILCRYELVDGEDTFLLLRNTGTKASRITLLREGVIRPGEPIILPKERDLWLKIQVQPKLVGRLRGLFYRPSEVHVKVLGNLGAAGGAEFEAPPNMLAAGFVASPFLLGNADMVEFYTGKRINRPSAYTVDLGPNGGRFWNEQVRYQLFSFEKTRAGSADERLQRLKYPGFAIAPDSVLDPVQDLQIYKGKPLLSVHGHKVFPSDVASGSQVILAEERRSALLVRPGGEMRLAVPAAATSLSGAYGFADGSYWAGTGAGAEFRIEEEMPDGSVHLIEDRSLEPRQDFAQRGLKPFRASLERTGEHKLILRVVARDKSDPAAGLTCWADIAYQ